VNALNPYATLRDLAMQELGGLAGPGGPLASLATAAGPGTPQAAALEAARARANAALATLANDDPARDDNVLKTDFDAVLDLIKGVMASPGALDPQDVRDVMDDLLGIARLIAEWHLERAMGVCGVCDGAGNPNKLCDAIAMMAQADAMRAAISPDWDAVVDAYGRAVELSLQAFDFCE
jgi:hypothetical protein